jgi:hypothetical protein
MDNSKVTAGDPYKHLWAAVLAQAAEDAWSFNPQERLTARFWIERTVFELGSFEWVCVVLSLDPERSRKAILACRNPGSRAKMQARLS